MSRLVATVTSTEAPSLWTGARSLLGSLSRAFASDRSSPGLNELDREHARIVLQSRHWLM